MIKIKKLIIPLTLIFVVFLGITSKANTSPDTAYDYLLNTSSTLLDSNLFTHVDDTSLYQQVNIDMTGFTKMLENDNLILYVNVETFAIRIKNKTTNFIWSSDYLDTSGIKLTNSVKKRMNSAFSFYYFDSKNRPSATAKTMLDSDLSLDTKVDDVTKTVTFYVDLLKYQIRLAYSIQLDKSSLKFTLNKDSIEEYGDNRLWKITFYEFLGAAMLDTIPGYNFIPSGNGALVRYTANSPINSSYSARFYNQDLYYNTEDNLFLDYPVYGSVHGINQNGFFENITSGAEFAEYNYDPPTKTTPFHIQSTTFYYREKYSQPIPGSTTSPTIIETNLKNYDINFNISFLSNDNANYVGMAKTYKDYLVESGNLTKNNDVNDNIGLNLDVLGSDYEEGIFFNKNYKMTTTKDILTINDELTSQNVNNIFYTLRGFNKGGYTKAAYNNYTFNTSLGSYKDLKDLNVAYYYNPVVDYQVKDKAPKNTLVTITHKFAQVPIMAGDYFENYMDIKTIINTFPKAYNQIENYGGMALDGLSNNFYSNQKYTREEMYNYYDNLLTDKIPMYDPNQIMLSHTSKFLTIPLQHERLKFFTDNVPFLEIVLSGYMPYYSTYLNFSANMRLDILKVIDFGANPAYLITKQPSHLLTNTLSREFYGSYYGNLSNYIVDDYQYINDALKNVIGQEIISRTVIADGIVVVKYSNNVEIMINYSSNNYDDQNGNIVDAMDYLVLGS